MRPKEVRTRNKRRRKARNHPSPRGLKMQARRKKAAKKNRP